MRLRVIADSQQDFQTWEQAQQAGPARPSASDATTGMQLFT
jgi:heme/copper-type cytochrome/quinol oxidase subunit 2